MSDNDKNYDSSEPVSLVVESAGTENNLAASAKDSKSTSNTGTNKDNELSNAQETTPEGATKEVGGPRGLEPTRYGDWESKGRCYDF